jgi:hypothetical protein
VFKIWADDDGDWHYLTDTDGNDAGSLQELLPKIAKAIEVTQKYHSGDPKYRFTSQA